RRRSSWITTTGRIFPTSWPRFGFRLATQISPRLIHGFLAWSEYAVFEKPRLAPAPRCPRGGALPRDQGSLGLALKHRLRAPRLPGSDPGAVRPETLRSPPRPDRCSVGGSGGLLLRAPAPAHRKVESSASALSITSRRSSAFSA